MCRPYLIGRYLRQSPTTYQSFLNKPSHDGCHILKPDCLTDTVQVIQVDIIRTKSAHGIFKMPAYLLVEIRLVRFREFTNMKFGGEHHLLTERFNRLTHQFLVMSGVELFFAIGFRRIKMRAAVVVCPADGFYGIRFGWHLPVTVAESHTSHSYRRYFQLS